MVAEQAIEALASREGIYFHEHPKDAHKKRQEWTTEMFFQIKGRGLHKYHLEHQPMNLTPSRPFMC